jgi:hypothetical protein
LPNVYTRTERHCAISRNCRVQWMPEANRKKESVNQTPNSLHHKQASTPFK